MLIDERTALSVTQISKYMKTLIDNDEILKYIWVKGEISNFKAHTSGHLYLTLKDEGSVLPAVMFRREAQNLKFMPKNGMQVLVCCRISVYEPMGAYQAYISEMKEDGLGDLHVAFEQLKARLFAEGLFDDARKKPLPKFPSKIGIVTSPTSAAVRDMINIMGRRWKYPEIYIYPSLVQGEGAPEQIMQGINYFDNEFKVDVIIIGRGGGSIEDLWAFNDEKLAYTIAACKTPIVSAVGHEIDYTISDFAADVRAATPSEAAQLTVPDAEELKARLQSAREKLESGLKNNINSKRLRLESCDIEQTAAKLKRSLDDRRIALDGLSERLKLAVLNLIRQHRGTLSAKSGALDALSPLAVLSRGYSIAFGKGGKPIVKTDEVTVGDTVTIRLSDGEIGATVEHINRADK